MKKLFITLSLLGTITNYFLSPETFCQRSKAGWIIIPSLAISEYPNESTQMGSGISFETLLAGKFFAGGLSAQAAWNKYMDVTQGYFKLMPKLGFGGQSEERTGYYMGISTGLFIANTELQVQREGIEDIKLPGLGFGFWSHFRFSDNIAFDLSYDSRGDYSAAKVGFVFSFLSLNVAFYRGPDVEDIYIFPGFNFGY